jgi:hypothetical protein
MKCPACGSSLWVESTCGACGHRHQPDVLSSVQVLRNRLNVQVGLPLTRQEVVQRITELLRRHRPAVVPELSAALNAEHVMESYARLPSLNSMDRLELHQCSSELARAAASATGEAKEYLAECLAIVRGIEANETPEYQARPKRGI